MVNEITERVWQAARGIDRRQDGPALVVRNKALNGDSPLGVRVPAGSWVPRLLDFLARPRRRDELAERFRSTALDAVISRLHRNGLIFTSAADEAAFLLRVSAVAAARDAMRVAEAAMLLGPDLPLREQDVDGQMADVRRRIGELARTLTDEKRRFVEGQVSALPPDRLRPPLRLHLGCGDQLLDGWVNVDMSGGDIRLDLRDGLPFADGSAAYVFCSYVVEHLSYPDEALSLLTEMRRVLRPDGVARIVVPDIEQCLRAYAANDDAFFAERAQYWRWAEQARTTLDQFLPYAGAEQNTFDMYGHKYGYDFTTLSDLLHRAGFAAVTRKGYLETSHDELRHDDRSSGARLTVKGRHLSLFVEATGVRTNGS
jgi:SAM-dependent methyltransferase